MKPTPPGAKSTQAEPAKLSPPGTKLPPDPRRGKVLRVLAGKLEVLRGECLPLAGSDRGRFIVTLDAGGCSRLSRPSPQLRHVRRLLLRVEAQRVAEGRL